MNIEESSAFVDESPPSLLSLSESDRERLSDALQQLLASGSINGLEDSSTALYHWVRQHDDWVKEIARLNGLEVAVYHEERLIQATPKSAGLRLRLNQDATLVWLALWYAGDVRWRDEGADQAFISVAELKDLLQDQLLPDASGYIPEGRLKEILRQGARFNMIRLTHAEPFDETGIEVLPAIRRVLPFRELAAWKEAAVRFRSDPPGEEPTGVDIPTQEEDPT